MKSAFRIQFATRSIAARLLLRALIIGSATLAVVASAPEDAPVVMGKVVVNEAKTHTLFLGADIAVSLGKDLFPVQGVVGSSWVIEVNGVQKVVSAKQETVSLKITPNLKLTEVSATIEGYKRARAYSFNNDPSVKLTRGLDRIASANADLQTIADNAQHIADAASNKALGVGAAFASADNPTVASSSQPVTTAQVEILTQQSANAAASQAQNGNEPGGRLTKTGLDAIEVEFVISAARPLHKPYVVTMARFHPKESNPGTVQHLVYAKELGPVGPHRSNVHFIEEGFPYDFELIDFQLHVYDGGEEVATTVSPKRVELTRDEAFEYVKIEYISSHKGATLPAIPAMGRLPADLPRRLAAGMYGETYYAAVSKDGLAGEAFLDAACTKKAEDPYLNSIVGSIRFKPALANGKPVEGVSSLNLRQLKI